MPKKPAYLTESMREALQKGKLKEISTLLDMGADLDIQGEFNHWMRTYRADRDAWKGGGLAIPLLVLLGIDPWLREGVSVEKMRQAVVPQGPALVELLLKVVEEFPLDGVRALAVTVLGLLHADPKVLEERGWMDSPLYDYVKESGDYETHVSLSLRQFPCLGQEFKRGGDVDSRVIAGLRDAFLKHPEKHGGGFPGSRLELHKFLKVSPLQFRNMFREERWPWEGKQTIYAEHIYGMESVGRLAALALVLLDDQHVATQVAKLTTGDYYSSDIGRRVWGLGRLAAQLGWNEVIERFDLESLALSRAEGAEEALLSRLEGGVGLQEIGALHLLGGPRIVEPLLAALRSQDPVVRAAAAWALGEAGDPRAREPLSSLLEDKKRAVRKAAAAAMKKNEWGPTN